MARTSMRRGLLLGDSVFFPEQVQQAFLADEMPGADDDEMGLAAGEMLLDLACGKKLSF